MISSKVKILYYLNLVKKNKEFDVLSLLQNDNLILEYIILIEHMDDGYSNKSKICRHIIEILAK